MRQIFVSYAQGDQEFAVRLAGDLRRRGAPVWIDVLNAEPGRRWTRSIERALSESHILLVVLSPEALNTAHVMVEWQAYLEAHRPVIPVLARTCDLPGPLRTRRPVDFRRDYARAVHDLTARLLEYNCRAQHVDPVIWTMTETVQGYRDDKTPPPPAPDSVDLSDPADGGLRRLVQSLRERLRPRRVSVS